MTPYALLDDALAPDGAARSRLYTGWRGELVCEQPADLPVFWRQADVELAAGAQLVILADYEWGVHLQGVPLADLAAPGCLRLLVFERCTLLDRAGVDAWLMQQDDGRAQPAPAGVLALQPEQDEAQYSAAIQTIQDYIRAGETYQVNHTLRLHGAMVGEPVALYRRLRAQQPVAFGALIALPGQRWVLSCSPELFVRHEAGRLSTRPMKGTTARHPDPATDQARADWLAHDVKNRAENLMIVDLLRNDLGRVARTGSVSVPQLFAIESYPTVHQMTSTVQAELPETVDFPAVLRALFPCGSITGAPKHHTMELIGRLERSPRGLYTGAIGWIDAPAPQSNRALGDFCLSVAIRTLEVAPPAIDTPGLRPVTLGVGGGIVLDSVAADEAAEAQLKARFVTACDSGWTLFETLRVEGGAVQRWPAHRARLQASAAALGFALNAGAIEQAVFDAAAQLDPGAVFRLRLDLFRDGRHRLQSGPLAANPAEPVRLLLADAPVPSGEAALLLHKTSLRSTYDAAIRQAEAAGAFDMLFFNPAGELTEGARSNVLLQLDGRWVTPPLSCGLLPGVMRSAWLADPALGVTEQVLTRADLLRAERLCVGNALRGTLDARLA
jgi:para-aminobenzoate synthetase/4-amino-4-deoxychorismate lyase